MGRFLILAEISTVIYNHVVKYAATQTEFDIILDQSHLFLQNRAFRLKQFENFEKVAYVFYLPEK